MNKAGGDGRGSRRLRLPESESESESEKAMLGHSKESFKRNGNAPGAERLEEESAAIRGEDALGRGRRDVNRWRRTRSGDPAVPAETRRCSLAGEGEGQEGSSSNLSLSSNHTSMAPLPAPLQRSNSPSPSTVSPLSSLPAEVLLQIASRLDFAALARYRRTSSACNAFVEASSELIYRRLCFSQGLLEERTCAATGLKPCLYGIESLADAFDAGELGRAVAAQRSMSGYYEGVEEWKELGKLNQGARKDYMGRANGPFSQLEGGFAWTETGLQACAKKAGLRWIFKAARSWLRASGGSSWMSKLGTL